MKPLTYPCDVNLTIEQRNVKPSFENNNLFFTKENVLTDAQCNELIEYADKNLHHQPNTMPEYWQVSYTTCLIPKHSGIAEVLEPLWLEAIKFYGLDIEWIEQYEIKKYSQGDFITEHTDQYCGMCKPYERKMTMVAQLSNDTDYDGGEFKTCKVFKANRARGSVIIIPSYFLHEVIEVTRGARYSLNCWAWGKLWR
jgi:predicted 2-oxoglutarate/Fe(II)-dependent dioxygenase YbiX